MAITSNPLRLFFLFLSLCSTIIGAAFVGKDTKFHECVAVFSVVFIIIGVLFNNRSALFVLSAGLMYALIPGFIGAAVRNVKEGENIYPYYYIEWNGDKVNAGYILMSSGMLLSIVSLLSLKDVLNIRNTIRRSNIIGLIIVLFLFIINLIGCILLWIKIKQLRVGLLQMSIYFFLNSLLFIYFYFNRSAYYYSAIGYFIFTYHAVLSLVYGVVINNSTDGPSMYIDYYDPDRNDTKSINQLITAFSLIFAAHVLFIPVLAHMANNNNNDNNNDNNNSNNNNRGSINNNNIDNPSAEGQPRVEQFRSGPKNIFRLILLFLCLIITIIGCILLKDKNDELIADLLPVVSVVLLIGTLFIDNNNNNNQYSIALYSCAFSLLILSLPHHIYDRSYHTNHPQNGFISRKKLDAGLLLLIIGASLAFFIRVLTKDYINNTNNNLLSGSKIEKGAVVLGLFGELIGFIGSILLFIVAGYLPDDYTLPVWTIPIVILLIFAFCVLLFSTSIYYRLLFIAVASYLIIRTIDGVQFNKIHYTKQDELRQVGLSLLSVAIGLLQISFCILLWPLQSESSSSPLSESGQEGISMATATGLGTESSAPEGISMNV